jgi:hypothetical protein
MAEVTNAERDTLEAIIDKRGIRAVVESLGEICFLKASHISETWQDEPLSRKWDQAGSYLEKVSRAVPLKGAI